MDQQNHMRRQSIEVRHSPQSCALPSRVLSNPPSYTQTRNADQAISPRTSTSSAFSPRDISTVELPPIQSSTQHESSLPSLSSVTGPDLYRDTPPQRGSSAMPSSPAAPNHWPSMNPLTQFYTPGYLQRHSPSPSIARMDIDSPSDSGRGNSVSLDDPDVRMAAEALGDLRADFVSSPPKKHALLPSSPLVQNKPSGTSHAQVEPLLSLLVNSHPSIRTTIEGATAVYTSSKNYSPRFKSGAESVEAFVSPLANTVGSVGRVTGFEGGLRWYLKRAACGRKLGLSRDRDSGERHKRRKVSQDGATIAMGRHSGSKSLLQSLPESDRRTSTGTVETLETLPAYDDLRSPDYTEADSAAVTAEPDQGPLKTRLHITTSNLRVSMSEESLTSLKHCLRCLRLANSHIINVIEKLKLAIEQYDNHTHGAETIDQRNTEREKSRIADYITELKNDVLKTLKEAIDTVSKYAGGALPENAKELVRSQLTSLPLRFSLAQKGQPIAQKNEQKEAMTKERVFHEGVQRVLVLAREGLEMMAQVSDVLDSTILSAEEWCEKLGTKRKADGDPVSLDATRCGVKMEYSPAPRISTSPEDTTMAV